MVVAYLNRQDSFLSLAFSAFQSGCFVGDIVGHWQSLLCMFQRWKTFRQTVCHVWGCLLWTGPTPQRYFSYLSESSCFRSWTYLYFWKMRSCPPVYPWLSRCRLATYGIYRGLKQVVFPLPVSSSVDQVLFRVCLQLRIYYEEGAVSGFQGDPAVVHLAALVVSISASFQPFLLQGSNDRCSKNWSSQQNDCLCDNSRGILNSKNNCQ